MKTNILPQHFIAVATLLVSLTSSASDTTTALTRNSDSTLDQEKYRKSAIAYLTFALHISPSEVIAGPLLLDAAGRMTVKAKVRDKNCTVTMIQSNPKAGYVSDAPQGWQASCV